MSLTKSQLDFTVEATAKLIDLVVKGRWQETEDNMVILPDGILPVLKIVNSFLKSKPYEVIDYTEDNFKISVFNRVDIMAAFKRHTRARMTGFTCTDCGLPIEDHVLTDDDPPRAICQNEPLN